eukprot:COSAG04_NODE_15696_length_523_cov_1.096698_1_plen_20_part_10
MNNEVHFNCAPFGSDADNAC